MSKFFKIKKADLKKKAEDIIIDNKYRNCILDVIDETENIKWIVDALARFISEEDCKRFCEIYELDCNK